MNWLSEELRATTERAGKYIEEHLFDPAYVRTLVEAHQSGRENYSRNLWGLLMFGLWYERYIEGR